MDWSDFLGAGQTHTPELEIAARFMLAALLGAAIGFEREARERPAGLKTHMLTALAASVFTVMSFEIFYLVRVLEPQPTADPIRVIEAVTAGVAFLAAGTIIQSRGQVHGLTTGAGVWMAGAIGVACGAGYYTVALIAVLFSVLILIAINRVERRYFPSSDNSNETP